MEKHSNKKFSVGLALIAILVVVCIILNLLLAQYKMDISLALANASGGYGEYTDEEIYAMGKDMNILQEEEGAVLLKNDDALPLGNKKVTILGFYSYAYIKGNGSGASAGYSAEELTMLDAFTAAGISVNESAWTTLRSATAKASHVDKQVTASNNKELSNYAGTFTSAVLGSYTDVAVITISRLGGEGASMAVADLQLHENERALLQWADETFTQVVVLINSPNVMELGEVAEYADAILWIGTPGGFGMQGVANILAGKVSPSGRTVDTWAYDMTTAPALYNVNDNKYANYTDFGFYQYEEGIYVGYRWYETADAEGYWNGYTGDYGDGYDGVVQYPFGYGLSYSSFTQEITSSDISLTAGGTGSVTVRVTNDADGVKAKEVVQLYLRAPYNQDETCGIHDGSTRVPLEKADKVLIGFAKTGEIEPGAHEDVTITFNIDDLASYDVFGHNCYVLEQGEYEFVLGQDAHNEWDSVSETLSNTIIYNEDGVGARSSDATVATNRLDDVTAGDGWSTSLASAYLSRSNFASGIAQIQLHGESSKDENISAGALAVLKTAGQKSTEYTFNVYENGIITQKTLTYYFAGALDEAYATENYYGEDVSSSAYKVTQGDSSLMKSQGIKFEDMEGAEYDDERWEAILNALTIDELIAWQCGQDKATPALSSIGLESMGMKDGACQVGADNKLAGSTWFACAGITAASWNVDMVEELGTVYGYQAVYYNALGVYAPSMDIHRTPLGGRNIEYYSEDGFISGIIGAAQVKGIQSTGTLVYLKHCLLNDNDTNRSGAITWVNEQALREIYAVPYEYSIKEGGALGIMGALNRIGMTWAHPGFYLSILRDEWGFNGFVITDMATAGGSWMSSNVGLLSGLAMMKGSSILSDSANDGVSKASDLSDYSIYMLREVAHHGLYQFVNGHVFSSPALELNTSWYIGWIIVDVVIGAGVVLIYIFMVNKTLIEKIKEMASNKGESKAATKEDGEKDEDEDEDDDD